MEWSDEELERAFAQSPEVNFQAVYDRFSGPLFRFLYRFTSSPQISEEILHDIFSELLNGKFKGTESGSLKAWLFTVAKNRGLNHRKKAVRETKEEIDSVGTGHDLEEETIRLNLLNHLERATTQLPQDLRELWDLRRNGLDYSEIAATLAIPVGTVKSRFSRLVDFLRREFGSEK